MVKRFENDYGDIRESLDGPFVIYEDYERLQYAVTALLTDIRTRYSIGEDETFKCQYLRNLESLIK